MNNIFIAIIFYDDFFITIIILDFVLVLIYINFQSLKVKKSKKCT